MSCTIIAVPYAIAWVVGTIASGIAANAVDKNNIDDNDIEKILVESEQDCNEDYIITEKHFIEKTFETPFTDKNILLKTLEEHGVINITEFDNGLSGEVDNYKLHFEKSEESQPYTVKISCLQNDNAEEKMNDLNSEYTLNVQEDAYLHILDKLKENNLELESEEVQDDNTIVLTINIE